MDSELPLSAHLSELRRRSIASFIFFIAAAGGAFSYSGKVLEILKRPLSGAVDNLVYFSPMGALSVYLDISFTTGLMVSMPFMLYQAWKFIEPAAGARLKSNAFLFVGSTMSAFLAGGLFAYFVLLPPAIKFLFTFAGAGLQPMISAEKYISFIVWTLLGTGLVFEMPVLSYVLSRLGVINHRFLREKYRYALVGILAVSAVITPTSDIFNMLLLAVPMLFLYEFSIWISKAAGNKKSPAEGARLRTP